MTGVPDAALLVIAAAIEDHRTVTPPDQSTPAGLAEFIAAYLISSHWTLTVAAPTAPISSMRRP
ncbi:hypothetical protein ACFCYM_09835 [Streptomyces sp. NPDC056254]|uniref:hypothetical protein n=1 Tax=Streptomyces sp. NPDC056254 TaxID=3345763 RepID=UPI0035DFAF63